MNQQLIKQVSADLEQIVPKLSLRDPTPNILLKALGNIVNDLVNNDFAALIQLLYRMDIAEDKFQNLLFANPGKVPGTEIAAIMIERQLEKIEARQCFTPLAEIPEDEKW